MIHQNIGKCAWNQRELEGITFNQKHVVSDSEWLRPVATSFSFVAVWFRELHQVHMPITNALKQSKPMQFEGPGC